MINLSKWLPLEDIQIFQWLPEKRSLGDPFLEPDLPTFMRLFSYFLTVTESLLCIGHYKWRVKSRYILVLKDSRSEDGQKETWVGSTVNKIGRLIGFKAHKEGGEGEG